MLPLTSRDFKKDTVRLEISMYNGLGMEVTEKQYNTVSKVMSSFHSLHTG